MLRVLFLGATALLAGSGVAGACSCIAHTLAEHVCRTPHVFEGEVLQTPQAEAPGFNLSARPNTSETRFRVTTAWKGTAPGEVVVRHGTSSAACGVRFQKGEAVLVFAHDGEQGLTTSLCSQLRSPGSSDEEYATALAAIRDLEFASEDECIAAVDAAVEG